MRCGPGAPPDRTVELRGSTATTRQSGSRALSTWPAPVMVPPVPTPATKTSTRSSASRISGPVVRRCASGLAGFSNCWAIQTSSRLAIARAAATASFIPPSDSMISTRAP